MLTEIKEKLAQGQEKSYSLELRFIAAFLALLITLLLAVGVIFASFGIFDLNSSKTAALIGHELNGIAEQIKTDFNTVTSRAVTLSEGLSRELKLRLDESNIAPADISEHTDMLSELLDSVFPTMAAEIRSLHSSGVFLILDATVNPELAGAEHSKAGVFIKNIAAHNNLSATYYDLRYLYGPMSLAQDRKMQILPQWSLEYDVSEMEAYNTVMMDAAENSDKPLSQQYYWTAKESDGGVDYGMYCSVPVIIDGTVVGVCGFEISMMQFKLSYAPYIDGQDYSFCMLAPSDSENIHFEKAMFAGSYAVTSEQPDCTVRKPAGSGLLSYDCQSAGEFVGNHTELSLYSASSIYAEKGFSVVLLTPKAQIARMNRSANMTYIIVMLLLLLAAATATVFLSRRTMKPVKKAFDDIRRNNTLKAEKTRIKEIDDLFEFLSEHDREQEEKLKSAEEERQAAIEKQEKATAEAASILEIYKGEITDEQYREFNALLRTLTEKEREVYDLYLQGKKAPQIAEICGITINTVKFHNKNIYDKLCINSRKELIRYAKYKSEDKDAEKLR